VAAKAALALATLVVALLLAEAGLAIAGYPPRYTDHQQLFVEYDSVRGWRNIPNAHRRYVTPEFTVELDYNAHAYRGPLVPYAKPAGVYRVLLLGDSYVEGYTVPFHDRVDQVAGRLLGPGVQFVALGTGGYSTDQELLWLESEGLRYAPDLVVVLFCDNDVWYNNRPAYPRGAKPVFRVARDSLVLAGVPVPRPPVSRAPVRRSFKQFLVDHSYLLRLIQRAVRRSPRVFNTDEDPAADEFLPFAERPTPAADSSVVMTEKLLAEMGRRVSSAGAQFAVVLIPTNDAVYPPGAPQSRRFHRDSPFGGNDHAWADRRFDEICARARVSCIDPTARFVAAAESLAQRDQLLLFPEDGHWNANGHRVAASVLADIVHKLRF
jgi:hypothetical protein